MKTTARDAGFNHCRNLPQEKTGSTEAFPPENKNWTHGTRLWIRWRQFLQQCVAAEVCYLADLSNGNVSKISQCHRYLRYLQTGNTGAVNTSYRGFRVQPNLSHDPISGSMWVDRCHEPSLGVKPHPRCCNQSLSPIRPCEAKRENLNWAEGCYLLTKVYLSKESRWTSKSHKV